MYAVYVPLKDAVRTEEITLPAGAEQWSEIHQKDYAISFYTVPEESLDRNVHWTSSDPDIAEIREYNVIRMHQTGTVEITGTLNSGASVSISSGVISSRLSTSIICCFNVVIRSSIILFTIFEFTIYEFTISLTSYTVRSAT